MNLTDVFNSNVFQMQELTSAINIVPNMYGRLNELGLFTFKPVATTSIVIEIKDGVLNLIPAQERGRAAPENRTGKRRALSFEIPHLPLEDQIKAADVQNVRRFGSSDQFEGIVDVTNDRLVEMSRKHQITWEYHRIGAVNGIILDADGTEIHNLFTAFGVAEKAVDFDFAVATDMTPKCHEVVGHMEDNLNGEVMTGVHALCSPTFFESLISHASVKDAYKYYTSITNPLREDTRRRFVHQGIVFEEYRGQATHYQADGTTVTRKFVAADEARFFPLGTQETFTHNAAPGDFAETVNTLGEPMYAKAELGKFGRWIDLHTQSNPLFLCNRPQLLVKGTST